MNEATMTGSVLPLGTSRDALTDVLRAGARHLLTQAIQAEVAAYLDARADCRDAQGRQHVVRNGALPARTILTGGGPVAVQQPRVRDRRPADQRERFTSASALPARCCRRTCARPSAWRS